MAILARGCTAHVQIYVGCMCVAFFYRYGLRETSPSRPMAAQPEAHPLGSRTRSGTCAACRISKEIPSLRRDPVCSLGCFEYWTTLRAGVVALSVSADPESHSQSAASAFSPGKHVSESVTSLKQAKTWTEKLRDRITLRQILPLLSRYYLPNIPPVAVWKTMGLYRFFAPVAWPRPLHTAAHIAFDYAGVTDGSGRSTEESP